MKKYFQDRTVSLSAAIAFMCILMALLFPTQFPTIDNFSQLLLNLSIDTIVAVGMMILMISGMFDLSVGSIVAFSGGLAGYLASAGKEPDFASLRRAVIYGSVLASFNVEAFSLERMRSLTMEEIKARYEVFRAMSVIDTAP